MKRATTIVIIAVLLAFSYSCEDRELPTPVIEYLSPDSKVAAMPTFELYIRGDNFTRDSVVYFNGEAKTTTYENPQELYATITSDDLLNAVNTQNPAGAAQDATAQISVHNPLPGGGESNTVSFDIKQKFTFTEPYQVGSTQIDNFYPRISFADDVMYISTSATDVETTAVALFAYSRDKGANISGLSSITDIATDEGEYYGDATMITSDSNGNVYMSWSYFSLDNYKILISVSLADDLYNFSSYLQPISTDTALIKDYKVLHFGSENAFAGYMLFTENEYLIYRFTRSIDFGFNWQDEIRMNTRTATSEKIFMEIDDYGNVYTAWSALDNLSNEAVFMRKSSDYGESFGPETKIYTPASRNDLVRFAKGIKGQDGKIYLAWWEKTASEGTDFKLTIASSDDTWSDFNITKAFSLSGYNANTIPQIWLEVDSAGNIYVVFRDTEGLIYIYRKDKSSEEFHLITDPLDLDIAGEICMTIDEEGSLYLVYTSIVEYEPDENDEDQETKYIRETWFVKSNE